MPKRDGRSCIAADRCLAHILEYVVQPDDKYIDIHTRFKADEISREQALEEMAAWAAKEMRGYGDGRVGTTEEVFRSAYEREWDEKHQ